MADNAPKEFAKVGQPADLTKYLMSFCSFQQRLGSAYQLLAIAIVTRGQFDNAIELTTTAAIVSSHEAIEKTLFAIKRDHKKFRNCPAINWDEIHTVFEDLTANFNACTDWIVTKKQLSSLTKNEQTKPPGITLTPSRSIVKIDPHLFRYRLIQQHCQDIHFNIDEIKYAEAVEDIQQFLTESLSAPLRDNANRLLAQLHTCYANFTWSNADHTEALKALECAQTCGENVTDRHSVSAIEISTNIRDIQNLMTYYLTEAEYKAEKASFEKLITLLKRLSSCDFYSFSCMDAAVVLSIYQELMTLYKHLSRYKMYEPTIEKAASKLLYNIALIKFELAFELTLHGQPHTEATSSFKALIANAKNLKRQLPETLQSYGYYLESLDLFDHKTYAKALDTLKSAEAHAVKNTNSLYHVTVQLQKIRILWQLNPKNAHVKLATAYNAIILMLNDLSTAKLHTTLTSMILASFNEQPELQRIQIERLELPRLLQLQPLFTARLKIMQFADAKNLSCQQDSDLLNDLIEAKHGSYIANLRLARAYKGGLFHSENSIEVAKEYAERAINCLNIPDEDRDKIDEEFGLTYIPIQFDE
ncbi:MAG: hypothetical protein M3R00_08440 [Pseudomonadota bacterium]|nr:hypothetical protein [Pseudomonadota bacterium]